MGQSIFWQAESLIEKKKRERERKKKKHKRMWKKNQDL